MGDFIFNTTGNGIISTYPCTFETDKRPRHEKFFGMTEEEIYKEYGLVFTKTNISIGNEVQYKISSDFEAELWMIKKGFIKYVRGRKVWHDEALEHGWENAWTPPKDYEPTKKSKELGHVYFIKSQGDYKIGSSNAKRIQRRVIGQCPDEILAICKPIKDFRKLEKDLHKEFASKRVLKYEIFKNLSQIEIDSIIKKLGGINVDVTQQHSKRRRMANG
jgi:hypothetical protein